MFQRSEDMLHLLNTMKYASSQSLANLTGKRRSRDELGELPNKEEPSPRSQKKFKRPLQPPDDMLESPLYFDMNSKFKVEEFFIKVMKSRVSVPVVFLVCNTSSLDYSALDVQGKYKEMFNFMITNLEVVRLASEKGPINEKAITSLPISIDGSGDFRSGEIDQDLLKALLTNIIKGGFDTF